MTDVMLAAAFDRPFEVEELRTRVSEINLLHAMQVVTQLSCQHHWLPDTPTARSLVNSINLSLLAKAFALWCRPDGRPMRLTSDSSSEHLWLLRAANSLPWYSRREIEDNPDATMIAYLVRQAYMIFVLNDPVDGLIARNFIMFHDLLQEVDVPVKDVASEFRNVVGVSLEDMWVVLYAVYAYYFLLARQDPRKWLIAPAFFSDTPRNDHFNDALAGIFDKISKTQDQLRHIYNTDHKYQDTNGRVGSWTSEFNVLRDFPIVNLGADRYCSPFPLFAIRRAIPGFYYDLLDDFARRERERGNKQPYRNDMRKTFQLLFQRYVGLQLEQLPGAKECLSPEFSYGRKGQKADSPDWILVRPDHLPVFFECKARQPALVWQSGATPDQIELDIRQTVTYALDQITKFLKRVDARERGTENYHGIGRIIYALVMHDPFPFHALPDLAARIESIASSDIERWSQVRERVVFVPMSIRELETAVGLELLHGVPVERQFEEYSTYRSGIKSRFIEDNGTFQFPRHLEEYLQEQFNDSRRIENPLVQCTWNRFSDSVMQHMYGESCSAYEDEMKRKWIEEYAYFRWIDEKREHGHHLRHWREAEVEYQRLEQEHGEAPWAVARLARYR